MSCRTRTDWEGDLRANAVDYKGHQNGWKLQRETLHTILAELVSVDVELKQKLRTWHRETFIGIVYLGTEIGVRRDVRDDKCHRVIDAGGDIKRESRPVCVRPSAPGSHISTSYQTYRS